MSEAKQTNMKQQNKRISLGEEIGKILYFREDALTWAKEYIEKTKYKTILDDGKSENVVPLIVSNILADEQSLNDFSAHFSKQKWLINGKSPIPDNIKPGKINNFSLEATLTSEDTENDIYANIKVGNENKDFRLRNTYEINKDGSLTYLPKEHKSFWGKGSDKKASGYTKGIVPLIADKKEREFIKKLLESTDKESVFVLYDPNDGEKIVCLEPEKDMPTLINTFNNNVFGANIKIPKEDQRSEKEDEVIRRMSEQFAIVANIEKFEFSSQVLLAIKSIRNNNSPIDTLLKEENSKASLDVLTFNTYSTLQKLSPPTFFDLSSSQTINKKDKSLHLLGKSNMIQSENLSFSQSERHKVLTTIMDEATQSSYSFIGSAIKCGITRIADSKEEGEISANALNTNGLSFVKFNSKEDAIQHMINKERHTRIPSFPALIEGSYYVISNKTMNIASAEEKNIQYAKENNIEIPKNLRLDKAEAELTEIFDNLEENNALKTIKEAYDEKEGYFYERMKDALAEMGADYGKERYVKNIPRAIDTKIAAINEQEQYAKKIAESLKDYDITKLIFGINNLSPKEKVLPNLLERTNTSEDNLVSIENMQNDPILEASYRGTGELIEGISQYLDIDETRTPLTKPFDMVDLDNNTLDEEKKVSSPDFYRVAGVADLKYFPDTIDLSTNAQKEVFLNFSIDTIKRVANELNIDEPNIDMFEKTLRNNLKDGVFAQRRIHRELASSSAEYVGTFSIFGKGEKLIANTNIPSNTFYALMKESGMIRKEDFIKPLTFQSKDIDNLYDKTKAIIRSDIASLPQIHTKIDKLIGRVLEKENEDRIALKSENVPFVSQSERMAEFSRTKRTNFQMLLKRMGVVDDIQDKFIDAVKTPKEIASKLFPNKKNLHERSVVSKLLEKVYVNQEFSWGELEDEQARNTRINLYFKGAGEGDTLSQEKITELSSILALEGEKDKTFIGYAMTMINTHAFDNYIKFIEAKKEVEGTSLTPDEKSSIMQMFNQKVLGLWDIQNEIVLQTLASSLNNPNHRGVNASNKRVGKTETTNATALLYSKTTNQTSVVIRGKSLGADQLLQSARMYIYTLFNHATTIGEDRILKEETTHTAHPLTEWNLLNIPNALKNKTFQEFIPGMAFRNNNLDGTIHVWKPLREIGLLKNPDNTSRLSPSEYLQNDYDKTIELILSKAPMLSNKEINQIITENKNYISIGTARRIFNSPKSSDTVKNIERVMYFYVLHIMQHGNLASEAKDPNVKYTLREMFSNFWDTYKRDKEISEKRKGTIVFADDQLLKTNTGTIKEINDIRNKGKFYNVQTHLAFDGNLSSVKEISLSAYNQAVLKFIKAISFPYNEKKEGGIAILPHINLLNQKNVNKKDLQRFYKEISVGFGNLVLDDMEKQLKNNIKGDIPLQITQLLKQKVMILGNGILAAYKNNENGVTIGHYEPIQIEGYSASSKNLDLKTIIPSMENLSLNELELSQMGKNAQIISSITEKTFTDYNKLGSLLNDLGIQQVATALYVSELARSYTKPRLNTFINDAKGIGSIKNVTLDLAFKRNTHLYSPIGADNITDKKKYAETPDNEKANLYIYELHEMTLEADIVNPFNPADITKGNIYPSRISLDFSEATPSLRIKSASVDNTKDGNFDYNVENKIYAKPQRTSNIVWNMEYGDGKVNSVIYDESHTIPKEIYEKMQDQFSTSNKTDKNLMQMQVSGTTLSIKPLSVALDNLDGGNERETKKSLLKYNSISTVKNEFIGFLLNYAHEIDGLSKEVITSLFSKALRKTIEEGAQANVYEYAQDLNEILTNTSTSERVKTSTLVNKHIPSRKQGVNDDEMRAIRLTRAHLTSYKNNSTVTSTPTQFAQEIEKALIEVSKSLLRDIQKKAKQRIAKENKDNLKGDEKTRLIDMEKYKLASEPMTIDTIFKEATNPSSSLMKIRSEIGNLYGASKVIPPELIIRDNDIANFDYEDEHTKPKPFTVDEKEELAILRLGKHIEKYRSYYKISDVFEIYETMIDISLEGLRRYSLELLGLKTEEFNTIASRDKTSVKNSINDHFDNLIKLNIPVPNEALDIFEKALESINFIISSIESIDKAKTTIKNNEKHELEFLPGFTIPISPSVLKKINTSIIIGSTNYKIKVAASPIEMKDKKNKYGELFVDGKKGLVSREYGIGSDKFKDHTIKYRTSIEYKPFKALPPIQSEVSFLSKNESVIIEAISATRNISHEFLKNVNENKNTRISTTRTENFKATNLSIINALLNRENKSKPYAFIVISSGNDEVQKQIRELKSPQFKKLLNEANITIFEGNAEKISLDNTGKAHKDIASLMGSLDAMGYGIAIGSNIEPLSTGKTLAKCPYEFEILDSLTPNHTLEQNRYRPIHQDNHTSHIMFTANGSIRNIDGWVVDSIEKTQKIIDEGITIDDRTNTYLPREILNSLSSEGKKTQTKEKVAKLPKETDSSIGKAGEKAISIFRNYDLLYGKASPSDTLKRAKEDTVSKERYLNTCLQIDKVSSQKDKLLQNKTVVAQQNTTKVLKP